MAAENANPSIRCAGSDQQGERRQGSLSSMSSRNTRRDRQSPCCLLVTQVDPRAQHPPAYPSCVQYLSRVDNQEIQSQTSMLQQSTGPGVLSPPPPHHSAARMPAGLEPPAVARNPQLCSSKGPCSGCDGPQPQRGLRVTDISSSQGSRKGWGSLSLRCKLPSCWIKPGLA